MKKGFLTNKYTISVIILLAVLATDVLLHQGMSRVILPESFTDKRSPITQLPACKNQLIVKGKKWIKAVNNLQLAANIDSSCKGFETDVYFDTAKNTFFVYHDSSAISSLDIDRLFESIFKKGVNASVWLDFKNLSTQNSKQALEKLISLRDTFALHNKIIVESPNIQLLTGFCDSNFYTSYYTPFFNPYREAEDRLVERIDSIAGLLKRYPVSALSGYYFQVPFLLKFFPGFPVLTWSDNTQISLVGNIYKYQLENQKNIAIVLYPYSQ